MEYVMLLAKCSRLLRLVNIRHHLSLPEKVSLDAKISDCIKELNRLEMNFYSSAMLEQFKKEGTV